MAVAVSICRAASTTRLVGRAPGRNRRPGDFRVTGSCRRCNAARGGGTVGRVLPPSRCQLGNVRVHDARHARPAGRLPGNVRKRENPDVGDAQQAITGAVARASAGRRDALGALERSLRRDRPLLP